MVQKLPILTVIAKMVQEHGDSVCGSQKRIYCIHYQLSISSLLALR